jgi:hypothetical protein
VAAAPMAAADSHCVSFLVAEGATVGALRSETGYFAAGRTAPSVWMWLVSLARSLRVWHPRIVVLQLRTTLARAPRSRG